MSEAERNKGAVKTVPIVDVLKTQKPKGAKVGKPGAAAAPKNAYDCLKCTGYCCSYDHIEVSKRDIERLAGHFDLGVRAATERFTKVIDDGTRVLRHRKDRIFKSMCMFFDQKKRCCTVYKARPKVCHAYPYGNKCGYYYFLRFERKHCDDEEMIP